MPLYISAPIAAVALTAIISLANIQTGEPSEIESLKQVFDRPEANSFSGVRASPHHPVTKAMDALGELGTSEALDVIEKLLIVPEGNQNFKQYALVVLGRLGTKPAIELIEKFEAWAEDRRSEAQPFSISEHDSACNHFNRHRLDGPLRATFDGQGTEWAVFIWSPLARIDVWMTSRHKDEDWSRPVLLDIILDQLPKQTHFSVSDEGHRFLLTVDGQSHRFSLEEKVRDRDRDGLTDLYEYRIGTDHLHPDCDTDGLLDGDDGNPLTRTFEETEVDDATEIRRAVFSVMFATGNSRDPIFMIQNGSCTSHEYKGYLGQVITTPVRRHSGVNIEELSITQNSPIEATVNVKDSFGQRAFGSYNLELRKKLDKWVVTQYILMGVT